MKILSRIRARLRDWLGIVYIDKHLAGRIRDLEKWRDGCIVAVPVDKHFKARISSSWLAGLVQRTRC